MGRLWAIYSFTVSYSYKAVVHGVPVWSFLGYAEECCGVTSYLASSVRPSSKYSYLESHSCCLMWCNWREHNAQSFEDCEQMIPKLKLFLFKTFFDWMLTFGSFSMCTFFLICLISVPWEHDFLVPMYTPCTCALSFINKNVIYFYKKKNSIIAKVTYESCQESPTS